MSITVLHVEDDPDFAEVAGIHLERQLDPLSVTAVPDAEEGLSVLERDDTGIDCIVSDFDMPGMSGLEFLRTVRGFDDDIPFILFTGKGSEEIASDAVSAGVTDYMQKMGGSDQYAVLANRIENAVSEYRARREAERARRRLDMITDASTDCIWMFDADWEELQFISGYEAVWQRPVEKIRENPQDFLNGVHPEDRPLVRDGMERMSRGESMDIEYRIRRGDENDIGWVWVKGQPVEDDAGNIQSVVGFTRDFTHHKETSHELGKERDFIRATLNALDDVFYVLNVHGELWRWNDRLNELTGYEDAEIEGMEAHELFPPAHRDQVREAIDTAFETGRSTVEAEIRTGTQDLARVELKGRRMRNDEEELIGLAGIGRVLEDRPTEQF